MNTPFSNHTPVMDGLPSTAPRCTPVRRRLALIAYWVVATACSAVAADPLALMQGCRQVAGVAARLACYDTIALPAMSGTSTVRLAPAPAAVAPTPLAMSGAAFGLPAAAPPVVLDALESTIPGEFGGWRSQTKFRLANGQLWQISDGSEGAYRLRDPKARVTRGTFGSFFLQIEGVSQTPRVRRIE